MTYQIAYVVHPRLRMYIKSQLPTRVLKRNRLRQDSAQAQARKRAKQIEMKGFALALALIALIALISAITA